MLKRFLIIFCLILSFIFTFANKTWAYIDETRPHWQTIPITVYIPQNNSIITTQNIQKAFQTWQNSSENKLQFSYINKENNGNIIIKFSPKIENKNNIASTKVFMKDKKLTKAIITITTDTITLNSTSEKQITNTLLHCIGSAIGLGANERKPASIMYTQISENQRILKSDIRKLYKIYGWSFFNRRLEK